MPPMRYRRTIRPDPVPGRALVQHLPYEHERLPCRECATGVFRAHVSQCLTIVVAEEPREESAHERTGGRQLIAEPTEIRLKYILAIITQRFLNCRHRQQQRLHD